MTPRTATVAGLGSGAAVALLLLVAFAALVPPPASFQPSTSPPGAPASGAPDGGSEAPSVEPTATPRSSLIVAGFHVGEKAPALILPQLGGGEIDLASLAGQPVWVNFMATYAPPSREEFALMNDFVARYDDTGLVVIAVDVREDEDTASAFAVDTAAAFPIGLDLDGAAQAAWDAPALPVHFWIDPEGVIRAGALGGLTSEAMAAHLQTILPNVEVTPPETSPTPAP